MKCISFCVVQLHDLFIFIVIAITLSNGTEQKECISFYLSLRDATLTLCTMYHLFSLFLSTVELPDRFSSSNGFICISVVNCVREESIRSKVVVVKIINKYRLNYNDTATIEPCTVGATPKIIDNYKYDIV